ncbi:hypothetical protein MKX03_027286, partial [Papaver bracteatum]
HWDRFNRSYTWSRVDEHDSVFYSLPGIISTDEQRSAEKNNSELVAECSNIQQQLNQEKLEEAPAAGGEATI